jgi:hypothetical protein
VAEGRADNLGNYAVRQSFEVYLGTFWGALSIACFSEQPLEVHDILINLRPFHSEDFQLVSCSLVSLGICEGSEKLVGELNPSVSVVFEGEVVVEPFPHMPAPFLD